MAFYHWNDCSAETRRQVDNLVQVFKEAEGERLVGVYLHGSLSMGGFDPQRSDLDVLAVTRQPMELSTRVYAYESLLALSGRPHPVEISVLCLEDLYPWRHPAPYDLHYSESWRENIQRALLGEGWKAWGHAEDGDSDLAAHITILNRFGVRLYGQEIGEVFPSIPAADYAASLLEEVDWEMERWQRDPMNALLSLVRVLAYLKDGAVLSKKSGGEWATLNLPSDFQPVVGQARALHQGEMQPSDIAMDAWLKALSYLKGEIDCYAKEKTAGEGKD